MMVFVRLFNSLRVNCLSGQDDIIQCSDIRNWLISQGLPGNEVRFECNGHRLGDQDKLSDGSVVHILLGLPGGKGGFGSMLRAIGAQIEKTTNREACRDLSGRRLRDINEEQRLKRWVAKKVEQERQAARRRRARLERLKTLPKHDFEDPNYDKQRAELPERMDDALNQGLTCGEVSSTQKRKAPEMVDKPKKPCLWLGIDNVQESDMSDDGSFDAPDEAKEESQRSVASKGNDNDSSKDASFPESSSSVRDHGDECREDMTQASIENMENELVEIICSLQESPPRAESQEAEPTNTIDSVKDLEPVTVDLMAYSSIEALKELGLYKLKTILRALGMKCGGTLDERAERLWAVRGKDPKDIDPSLLAKPRQ